MPPHLHPRSRMTSSLFATTVIASFFVVALPHVLPCPAPRTMHADSEVTVDENGRRRRRRRPESLENGTQSESGSFEEQLAQVRAAEQRSRRECPVPKPGGMLGEWLGFHGPKTEEQTPQKRVDR